MNANNAADLVIKQIGEDHLEMVFGLVWRVFLEFEAPDYAVEGVEHFKTFIQPDALKLRLTNKGFFILGAFLGEILVGVLAVRDFSHISLLFVDKAYPDHGIAKRLFQEALRHCTELKHDITEITVNSSPYAVEIYRKLGFAAVGEQTTRDGITFVPMSRVN